MVSELHEDYAEASVSSYFALFSTILDATPAQALRAAMRLYEQGLGMSGFVLCLMDLYTGARWGELVGHQRHEYDSEKRGIEIRTPLKEVGGKVYKGGRKGDDHHADGRQRPPTRRGNSRPKKGRTKTPAGTRFVALPPGIAVPYEELMETHREQFVTLYAGGTSPAVELPDPVLAAGIGRCRTRRRRGGGAAPADPADVHL